MFLLKSILSLILLVSSFAIAAKTIETVEFKYFVISPQSPNDIRHELIRNSPIRNRQSLFTIHANWSIDWEYKAAPGPNGCKLYDIKTKVYVVHTLPSLSEQVIDKQTIETFNKFNDALTQHQDKHGNIGLSAAREIDETLQTIQPQQNCQHLARMVGATGRSIVQKYIQYDHEYDRTTNYGETEGAVIY